MKTIGLIGGMSWQSSVEYYRIINEECNNLLGGFHSGQIMMCSVDFDPILNLQHEKDWDRLSEIMAEAALKLEKSGADFILICANTMHKTANYVQEKISVPLIHIADTLGEELRSQGISRVGLLSTPYTMLGDFYVGRLKDKFNIEVIIPEHKEERDYIYKVICDELTFGIINETSKKNYVAIMQKLVDRGAQGIILGCTEIPLLVKQEDTSITLFDTTRLHALAAVKRSVENSR